jgi:hypothetical protein
MAKKRKRPPKDEAAFNERTRMINARIAELTRQIEEREQAERKPDR